MKTIHTPGATIKYRDDGIIHIQYDEKLINLEEAQAIFKVTRENSDWEISPILATGSTFTNFESDAIKYLASKEVLNNCSAVAMISKTLGEKIAANFYIKFLKPASPTKFFSTEEEAVLWLKQFETVNKK